MNHSFHIAALCTLALLLVPSGVTGQKQSKRSQRAAKYWQVDPYTKNEKALLEKAGYVGFGPMTWGDDHDSNDIRKMFPEVRLLFVETAHFKICSALPEYRVSKAKALERKILKQDLSELKKIFPDLKTTRTKLDPWLRLHLTALRLERTYADFSKRLGVKDSDFPQNKGKRIALRPGQYMPYGKRLVEKERNYMGQGPYLGMRGKFLFFLARKGANLTRYAARAKGGLKTSGDPQPQCHYFTEAGSLFFGTSCECAESSLYNDHAMHCHLVFNAVKQMVDGYKDFYYSLPAWCRDGIPHWYVRNIDPKEHCFTGIKGRSNKKRYAHDWDVKIRKRVKHKDFTPATRLMQFMQFTDMDFGDHMAAWSRIDFLLSLGDAKFARFMSIMKDWIEAVPGQLPKAEAVIAQQWKALKTAYGCDAEAFDAAWSAYVLKTYSSR